MDVPEVNSRIALRTIGKSINDQSGGGVGGGSGGSAQALANNRSDQAEYQAESLELRPIQALEARKDAESSENRVKKSDIMKTLSEELEAKNRNVTVVVPVQHHSPSLGEDKTDQRCVSFSLSTYLLMD